MRSPRNASTTNGTEFAAARAALLMRMKAVGVSERVAQAVLQTPRERFVLPEYRQHAWLDESLPINAEQTISQPSLVGKMIEHLRLQPDHTVLDIGTGSGYQAAILSQLARKVIGVERVKSLCDEAESRLKALGYDNVEVHVAGRDLGWPAEAPYDGIIVAAASPEVPRSLVEQLNIGGRMVIPVGAREEQEVVVVERTESGTKEIRTEPVRFVPLIGEGAWDS